MRGESRLIYARTKLFGEKSEMVAGIDCVASISADASPLLTSGKADRILVTAKLPE